MKFCSKCGITKENEFFCKSKQRKDGLHIYCKVCLSSLYIIYKNEHSDLVLNMGKKSQNKYRKENNIAYNTTQLRFRDNGGETRKRAKRRAQRLNANVSWANQKYIKLWYKLAKIEQERTGRSVAVDHIVPLISDYVCGLHCEDNMQLLFREDNSVKGNRTWPDMWDIDKELISLKNQYKKIPQ